MPEKNDDKFGKDSKTKKPTVYKIYCTPGNIIKTTDKAIAESYRKKIGMRATQILQVEP